METRASYVLIGTFTLLVFLAGFGFVLWIGKLSLDREWDFYDVIFKEAVTGLTVGGAVQYNGIQVGDVRKLSLAPDDPRQVIARVRLNGDTPVKTDTKARLTLIGLTGVTVIQLSGGTPNAQRLIPKGSESVARIIADESALQSLLASGQDFATSANEALLRVDKLLSDDNLAHVAGALEHIDALTGVVADQREDLRRMIAQLSGASSRLNGSMNRLDALTASTDDLVNHQARQAMDSARAWLDAAQRVTDTADGILVQNRGAIANFSNEGLAQIGPAIAELHATLRALHAIAARLQDDPAKYLLGREQTREFEPK